ncbi:MAG TPA: calcium-binding protein [Solirubrobacterales bacterium]|nr:calcium-binding protein [Solirubrobacterales bacterium]
MVRLHLIATLLAPAALLACPSAEAKVTARVAGQILTVQGGKGADRVKVVCGADANVKVNGRDPRTGRVLCSQVVEVDAVMRDGDDRVDLSGVDGAFGETDLAGFGRGTGVAAKLGPGDDTYIGSASAFNLVLGGPGDDRILGGALRDHLVGGRGEDLLRGRAGNDLLLGGQGDDRILGGPGDDLISANQGDDSLFGGAGADLLGGGSGDDRLLGGPGPDRLYGGPGRDILFGGSGNDLLVGGPGKDRLDGGPGDNVLVQGLPKAK